MRKLLLALVVLFMATNAWATEEICLTADAFTVPTTGTTCSKVLVDYTGYSKQVIRCPQVNGSTFTINLPILEAMPGQSISFSLFGRTSVAGTYVSCWQWKNTVLVPGSYSANAPTFSVIHSGSLGSSTGVAYAPARMGLATGLPSLFNAATGATCLTDTECDDAMGVIHVERITTACANDPAADMDIEGVCLKWE